MSKKESIELFLLVLSTKGKVAKKSISTGVETAVAAALAFLFPFPDRGVFEEKLKVESAAISRSGLSSAVLLVLGNTGTSEELFDAYIN